jgi:predicted phage tail protein
VNGHVTNNPTPEFSWNAVSSGNRYQIQISKTADFAVPEQDDKRAAGILTYMAASLNEGKYYWRVRAWNVMDEAGTWSAARSFTVTTDLMPPAAPVLNAPANGASPTSTPTFSWKSSATAIRYQFQYDEAGGDFSVPVYSSAELSSTSIKPPAMKIGIYDWRVRARDASGNWSEWSLVRTINIKPKTPAVPKQIGPVNGSISVIPRPAFTWQALDGVQRYEIELDMNSSFNSPEYAGSPSTAVFTPGVDLADGVYYWRVRQVDVFGRTGAWSAIWRVTVVTP